jgi:16S rRNA (adenine1518-N6/adenine1519-N6)-dimethyltransferase
MLGFLRGTISDMDIPYAKKSLGQHWLHDSVSLDAICDIANLSPGDTVLEIGPGTGTLTTELLKRDVGVVAVELDKERIPHLRKNFKDDDFILYQESILTFDLTKLPAHYKLVANIPYYLTSHLIRILSESTNPPVKAALLVQKEVAERVAADPGQMSLLSVTAQFYWEIELGELVPAYLFTPPPKVDSQILGLTRRSDPLFDVDESNFFRLVKAGFSNRRKKLDNSLSGGLRISKNEAVEMITKAGLQSGVRAQELSLNDWYKLYQASQE